MVMWKSLLKRVLLHSTSTADRDRCGFVQQACQRGDLHADLKAFRQSVFKKVHMEHKEPKERRNATKTCKAGEDASYHPRLEPRTSVTGQGSIALYYRQYTVQCHAACAESSVAARRVPPKAARHWLQHAVQAEADQ